MAHGDYYNPANKSVTDGTVVYADDINKINPAIDSALEQVAYDLDVIEADLEAGGLSAKNWATEDQGTRPDPILDLYSASCKYCIHSSTCSFTIKHGSNFPPFSSIF